MSVAKRLASRNLRTWLRTALAGVTAIVIVSRAVVPASAHVDGVFDGTYKGTATISVWASVPGLPKWQYNGQAPVTFVVSGNRVLSGQLGNSASALISVTGRFAYNEPSPYGHTTINLQFGTQGSCAGTSICNVTVHGTLSISGSVSAGGVTSTFGGSGSLSAERVSLSSELPASTTPILAPPSSVVPTTSTPTPPAPTTASTPPTVAPPAKPLPLVATPAPTDACHQVVSQSGHIQLCVPSWLTGSSEGGVTYIQDGSSGQPFDGQLPVGATLSTGSNGYASLYNQDTEANVSVAPGSSVSYDPSPSWVTPDDLMHCENLSTNCELGPGYIIAKAADEALEKATEGKVISALYTLGKGEIDAADDVLRGVRKAAMVLVSPNTLATEAETTEHARLERGVSSIGAAAGPNVEETVTASGTTFYVTSGSWLIVDVPSEQFATVTAGHELFVPASRADAARENLKASIKAFSLSSVDTWWQTSSTQASAGYTISGCWSQYSSGWATVKSSAATSTFTSTDLLQRGLANFWSIVALDHAPTSPIEGATVTLVEPNGTTFATTTLGAWTTSSTEWEVTFNWTFSDGSAFFQKPQTTGQGTWTVKWQFPDNQTCTNHFAISTG